MVMGIKDKDKVKTIYHNKTTVDDDLKSNFKQHKTPSKPGLVFTASNEFDSRPQWMLNQEEKKRQDRIWWRKFWMWFFIIFLCVAAVVVPILYCYFSCTCYYIFEGHCSIHCRDCDYKEGNWKKLENKDTYVAYKRRCGAKVYITIDGQDINVSDTEVSGEEEGQDNSTLYLTQHKNITLKMNLNNFAKNNESMTIEFWDNGTEFMGLGDFQNTPVRNKAEKSYSYTLWNTWDDPTYLPFYISRNVNNSAVCVVLDAAGSPAKVTVDGNYVQWKVFSHNFAFHVSNGSSVSEAMAGCLGWWKERYTYPVPQWSEKVILGSANISEIDEARLTSNILASDYYLMDFNITNDEFLVNGSISNWDDIMLRLSPSINITNGEELRNDSYNILQAEEGKWYLDFGGINSTSEAWYNKVLASQDVQGFFLSDGYLPGKHMNDTKECIEKYLKCDTLDYNEWETFCTSAKFGASGDHFHSHNIYDRDRSIYIREQLPDALLIQSTAAPGIINFYRENLKATWSDLNKCFNEMLNMQLAGVIGYSCNLCGGELVTEGLVCDRWSQMAVLMSYTIMTNETEFPLLVDGIEPGRYVKNNLAVRKELRHYLASSFENAIADNTTFAILTSLYFDIDNQTTQQMYHEQNTLMIGDGLFYAPILSEVSAKTFNLPPKHKWISLSSFSRHSAGEEIEILESETSALDDLLYIKSGVVMLFSDADNGNLIDLNVFPDENDEVDDEYKFHYGDSERTIGIKLKTTDDTLKFNPEDDKPYFENTMLRKLIVHYWYKQYSCTDDRVTYEQQGTGWKITYDYTDDLQQLFRNETWSIDLSSEC